ncbi:MAG: HNH endonuclease [Patescibacteria group bacterium]|jgi:5-methylcytosine-specific restriction endonuclease McrA
MKLKKAREELGKYFGPNIIGQKSTWKNLKNTIDSQTDFKCVNGKADVRRFIRERISPSLSSEIKHIKKKNHRKSRQEFYMSEEWRSLRYNILKKYKGCCCLCGRSYQKHGVVIHVDHIKPRSKYPELELDENNLQLLCEDCNLGKSNKDSIDWRPLEKPIVVRRRKLIKSETVITNLN